MADQPSEKPTNRPAEVKEAAVAKKEPVVVKKYANRRLYNTETSTYVTLDDLAAMVKNERDFVVYDAKSSDDLTHSVLTQIIVEQESQMASGQTMLPIPFLRQLIRFYGDSVGKLVPSYLQVSLDTLTREQGRMREQFASAFSPQSALEAYHEQARKNLTMFEQAMRMFSPFTVAPATGQLDEPKSSVTGKPLVAAGAIGGDGTAPHLSVVKPVQPAVATHDQILEMRAQMAAMQATIDKLAKDRN